MSAPEFPEVVEVTHEEALDIAASYLKRALKYLDDGDTVHAAVFIDDALVWMGKR